MRTTNRSTRLAAAWVFSIGLLSVSAQDAGAQPRVIGVYNFEEIEVGKPAPKTTNNAIKGSTSLTAATLTEAAAAPDAVAATAPNKVALSFTKPGAAMNIPDAPEWATAANTRMEMRLRLANPTGGNSVAILHRPQRAGAPPLINVFVNGTSLTLSVAVMMEGDRVETVETPMNFPNRWVYLAVTLRETTANNQPTVNVDLWADGALRVRRAFPNVRMKRSRDTTLPGWIVGRAWDTSATAKWSNLNGPIDEVRLATTDIPIAPLPNGTAQPVNAFGNEPHIVPGSLSSVSVLLPTTKFSQWDGKVGEDGKYLTTALDGVSVDVDGLPALVTRTNPATVQFIPQMGGPIPESGVATVTVKGEFGSFAVTTPIKKVAPTVAFWNLVPAQLSFAIAWGKGGYIGPDAWLLGVFPMTPAKPGETISLMASGLGPTNPVAPADRPLEKDVVYNVDTPESIYLNIGEVWVKADAAVLTAPGTYRIDFVVPELPDGDHLIKIHIGDLVSNAVLFPVQTPPPPPPPPAPTEG